MYIHINTYIYIYICILCLLYLYINTHGTIMNSQTKQIMESSWPKLKQFFQFSPTAECFGVSAHIAFGVIPGTGRHCCLARVPGTEEAPGWTRRFREPGAPSKKRQMEDGSGNHGFCQAWFSQALRKFIYENGHLYQARHRILPGTRVLARVALGTMAWWGRFWNDCRSSDTKAS